MMYQATKDYDKALKIFDGITDKNPQMLTALLQFGTTASFSGLMLEEAIDKVGLYIEHDLKDTLPSKADAFYLLGLLHEQKKDRESAKSAYKNAVLLEPEHKNAKKKIKRFK